MGYRIDKYIWSVRLSKTRSIATELVQKGKFKLNNGGVKPSKEVKVGDVISIIKNNAVFSYKVKALLDKRVGAKFVEEYLMDITPNEEREKFRTYQAAQGVYREYGTGRPSRKDRDNFDQFFEWLEDEEGIEVDED